MEDSHNPLKDPSSGPAKFQIGASDEEFDEPEVEIVVVSVWDGRGHPPPSVSRIYKLFPSVSKNVSFQLSSVVCNVSTIIMLLSLR